MSGIGSGFRNGATRSGAAPASDPNSVNNVVFKPFDGIHINVTNSKYLLQYLAKHVDDNCKTKFPELANDIVGAFNNLQAAIELTPVLLTSDVGSLLSDPKRMLDVGQIKMDYIVEDAKILYAFIRYAVGEIKKVGQQDAVLLVIPLLKFLTSPEGDAESMERISKQLAAHMSSYFSLITGVKDNNLGKEKSPAAVTIQDLLKKL